MDGAELAAGIEMKTSLPVAMGIVALLVGCGEKSSSLATAPVDYLNTAVKAEQNTVKQIDTTSLEKAVQLFNVDKGRYPKDLNELVQERYYATLPPVPYGNKLDYDANSGRVRVVKQ